MSGGAAMQPVARLRDLAAYETPRPAGKIDLWLAGNEGRAPDARLIERLVAAGPDVLRRYPSAGELEAKLAGRFGVRPEQVLVTAGADDALLRCCLATLEPGREIVLPVPTFEMLPRYAQLAGGTVRELAWPGEAFPRERVCAAVTAQTAAVAIVSPNNPTGAVASAADLLALAAAAPRAALIVDCAYAEFADEDLTATALALPQAIVTRTFSKAWGLAGLRVGYALGSAAWIARLRAVGNPYAVSGPSLCLAAAALEAGPTDAIAQVRDERRVLFDLLRSRGAAPLASQGNFVFARVGDAYAVWRGLAARGIAIRIFGDRPGLRNAVRISCPGDAAAFARLCAALADVPGCRGAV